MISNPVTEQLIKDAIVLYLHPYGQFNEDDISDFVGHTVGAQLYDLTKDNLIQSCEIWDSENDVSLGTSDKFCLTDAGREYALSINPPMLNHPTVDEWIYITSLSVMGFWYRTERKQLEGIVERLQGEKVSILSELNQTLADYQDLVKRNTEQTRHVSKLQRQYKDLAFIVGFCVKALAAATRGMSTNSEKVGQMELVKRLLEDGLNDVDLSEHGIPF